MVVDDGADIAGMGGLMGTAMYARGYAGAVIDGGVRDVAWVMGNRELQADALQDPKNSCQASNNRSRCSTTRDRSFVSSSDANPVDAANATESRTWRATSRPAREREAIRTLRC